MDFQLSDTKLFKKPYIREFSFLSSDSKKKFITTISNPKLNTSIMEEKNIKKARTDALTFCKGLRSNKTFLDKFDI